METQRLLAFNKEDIQALLLENVDQAGVRVFDTDGYHIRQEAKSLVEEDLKQAVSGVHILGIRSKTNVTEDVLSASRRLIALGAYCVGTEQIDLQAASRCGVAVFNDPNSNGRSVAELAIGNMIMLSRGVAEKNRKMHLGEWDKSAAGAFELRGRTLGVIGKGNIGSQVADLAEGFGMNVIYYDLAQTSKTGSAKSMDSMGEVLTNADVITLHVNVDDSHKNYKLIGAPELEAVKPGVLLLNLSRGCVVDEHALAEAIRFGKVAGAAIDVFSDEPASNAHPFSSPLQGLTNVILTPHIGGSTVQAQREIGKVVSSKIVRFMNTGDTTGSVNLPEIRPDAQNGNHRILNIHHNRPGVLAQFNEVLYKHKLNIVNQHSRAEGPIGYAVTDIATDYDLAVLKQLRAIPDVIKMRPLF